MAVKSLQKKRDVNEEAFYRLLETDEKNFEQFRRTLRSFTTGVILYYYHHENINDEIFTIPLVLR